MNKSLRLITYLVILSSICFMGCGNNGSTKNAVAANKTSEEKTIVKNVDLEKEIYLQDLDDFERKLGESLRKKYIVNQQSTFEEAKKEEYNQWLKKLNIIYNKILEELPQEEKDKLIVEEEKWIKETEDKNLKSKEDFNKLIAKTKDRCYELVNKYMK